MEKLTNFLVAIKEDEDLANILIQICMLPQQQRIIEIDKFISNGEYDDDQCVVDALQLIKFDEIAQKSLEYLQEK